MQSAPMPNYGFIRISNIRVMFIAVTKSKTGFRVDTLLFTSIDGAVIIKMLPFVIIRPWNVWRQI